jgi:hypothetical protein
VKLAIRLVPRGLQERARPHVDRFQAFVREFEWTWTKAVVASLVLWLYFADQKLGWHRCPCPTTLKFFLFKARDVVAIILFSIPFGGFIMIPYHLQKLRRRLRSESESRPTGGYR